MHWSDTERIEVKSETSDRIYVVAKDLDTDTWGCSCPGWRTRRTCKHLRSANLPTVGSQGLTGNSKPRKPTTFAADFADTKKHYDPSREGYGNAAEWRKQAESIIAGKGALKVPAATASPTTRPLVNASMAADMAALGVRALPPNAEGLLAAMQAKADVLNDPITGNPDEFWRVFEAFERLAAQY